MPEGTGVDLGSVFASIRLQLQEFHQGIDQAKRQVRQMDQDLAQSTRNVERNFTVMGRNVQNIIAATFSVAVIRQAIRGINDLAQTAHQAEAGGIVFARMLERVGESAREVTPELEALAEELRVAPEVLRSNAAELLRAGYTWEQAATIYRGAGASALLAGRSTGEGVEIATSALVSGLSTYLNQIGIVQNLSTAYTQYARELGKTTDQLTDAERAQAATLMIQRATAQEMQDLPVLLDGYGGTVSDLSLAWYDFRVTLGTLVIPTLTAAMRAVTDLLSPVTSLLGWIRDLRGASRDAADALTDVSQGSLEHARAAREQADEVERLLTRFQELSEPATRTAEEQREIEQVMSDIADLQPGLVAGYRDLEAAIRDNIDPLREYAQALRDASNIELEIAARRAQLELPSLREERERVIAERDALIGQNREQFLQAQRLQTLAAEATRLFQQMATAPLSSPEQLEARRELERFLSEAFPGEFEPGFDPALMDFTLRLQEMARESMAAFGGMATKIEELDARAKALAEQIQANELAVEAFDRAQQGLDPFPAVQTGGDEAGGGGGVTTTPTLDETVLDEAARWQARITLAEHGYGNLRELRQQYADWLAGQVREESGLELETRARLAQELGRINEEIGGTELDALAHRLTRRREMDEEYAEQYRANLERQASALLEEVEFQRQLHAWSAAEHADALQAILDNETITAEAREDLTRRVAILRADAARATAREEKQAAEKAAREADEAARSWAESVRRQAELGDWSAEQQAQALQEVLDQAVMGADLRADLEFEVARLFKQARDEETRAAKQAEAERKRADDQAAEHRAQLEFQLTQDINRVRMTETDFFAWQLSLQVEMFRAAGIEEARIMAWTAAMWDEYWEQKAEAAADALKQVEEEVQTLGDLIRGSLTAELGQTGELISGIAQGAATGNWAAAGASLFDAVISESEHLAEAFDALTDGIAALLAPLDALLGSLEGSVGKSGTGALVGAGAGWLIGGPVGAAIGGLLGFLGGSRQEAEERQRQAEEEARKAEQEWRRFLREADYGELVRREESLRRQMDLWSQMPFFGGGVAGVYAERLEELREAMREALDVTADDLRSAVRGAFSAETAEEFSETLSQSLHDKVREAIITAFLESAAMRPIWDALSDAIVGAVQDGILTAAEIATLEQIIARIEDKAAPFYEALEELGLVGGGEGEGDTATGGTRLTELTGRSRDLFAEMLRPLGSLDRLPWYGDGILTELRQQTAYLSVLSEQGQTIAAAERLTLESGQVIMEYVASVTFTGPISQVNVAGGQAGQSLEAQLQTLQDRGALQSRAAGA